MPDHSKQFAFRDKREHSQGTHTKSYLSKPTYLYRIPHGSRDLFIKPGIVKLFLISTLREQIKYRVLLKT